MRFRKDPKVIGRQSGIRNERHETGILRDDTGNLFALLRNLGAGKALTSLSKKPAGSPNPLNDLSGNDRQPDDLRVRMLL